MGPWGHRGHGLRLVNHTDHSDVLFALEEDDRAEIDLSLKESI